MQFDPGKGKLGFSVCSIFWRRDDEYVDSGSGEDDISFM